MDEFRTEPTDQEESSRPDSHFSFEDLRYIFAAVQEELRDGA